MKKLLTITIVSIGLLAGPVLVNAQGEMQGAQPGNQGGGRGGNQGNGQRPNQGGGPGGNGGGGRRGGNAAPAPVVHPDYTVTFTYRAPQANSVILEGGWPGGMAHTSVPMTKDDKGVWTVTTPVPQDMWTYSYKVDGATVQGARNGRLLVAGPAGSESYNLEMHDNPHGTVAYVWYPAPKLGLISKLAIVYLPAAYSKSQDRYPVLYIAADDINQMVSLGRVPTIMDNVIAAGKAKPMIVVIGSLFPNEAAPESMIEDPLPQMVGKAPGYSSTPNAHGDILPVPHYLDGAKSFATDLASFIDGTYRTIADRDHRAIAGVGTPGAAAFYAAATNPKTFGWIAGFSDSWPSIPGVWQEVPAPADAATRFPPGGPDIRQNVDITKFAAMAPDMNAKAGFHPIYLYQGLNDPLYESHIRIKKLLDQRGVKYVSVETPNAGYEWRYWNWAMNDYAQHVFQGN